MTLLRLELTDSLCRSWDLLSITTWANSLQYIPLHIYKECVCVCVYVCVCEPGGIQFMGLQRVRPDWAWCMMCTCIHTSYWFCFPGELWLIQDLFLLPRMPSSTPPSPSPPPTKILFLLQVHLRGYPSCNTFLDDHPSSLHPTPRQNELLPLSTLSHQGWLLASHDVVFLV